MEKIIPLLLLGCVLGYVIYVIVSFAIKSKTEDKQPESTEVDEPIGTGITMCADRSYWI